MTRDSASETCSGTRPRHVRDTSPLGVVRDSASDGLGEVRFAKRELAAAVRKSLAELVAKKGDSVLANRLPTLRADRFVLQAA